MKNMLRLITSVLLIAALISGCSSSADSDSGKLTVAVSIGPQEAIVKAIAGDLVKVVTIIPPGASPANYQPTPKQIQTFEEASIYFSIGVPTEEANIFPNMVDGRDDLQVIHLNEIVAETYSVRYFDEDGHEDHDENGHENHDEDEHDDHDEDEHDNDHDEGEHDDDHDEDDHDHSGADPHIWMSPKRMMVMAEEIYHVLSEADPDNADTYKEGFEVFLAQLVELDNSLSATIGSLSNKEFIIMHPSLGYFADDYGLEMVALEKDGKESTASHLAEVIEYAKEHDIHVVFYQAEFDSSQAQTLANEIGGKTLEFEPLATDYINNMKEIEQTFIDVLD